MRAGRVGACVPALAYLPACVDVRVPACLRACLPACLPACARACVPACLCGYARAYLPACMPACLPLCVPASLREGHRRPRLPPLKSGSLLLGVFNSFFGFCTGGRLRSGSDIKLS